MCYYANLIHDMGVRPSSDKSQAGAGPAVSLRPSLTPRRPRLDYREGTGFGAQAPERAQSWTELQPGGAGRGAGEFPMARPDHEERARAAAARAARESYGKLVAYLAAPRRDVPGAEDALADAFAAALTVWPAQGIPANPEGWLAKAARRRMIDFSRRRRSAEGASDALALIAEELEAAADERRRSPTGAWRSCLPAPIRRSKPPFARP